MRKCTVSRQALCSASSAISGDAAEGGGGGARLSSIVQPYTFKHTDGEIWGPNTHSNVCGLGMNNEPKHNVWVNLDLIKQKRFAICVCVHAHLYVCMHISTHFWARVCGRASACRTLIVHIMRYIVSIQFSTPRVHVIVHVILFVWCIWRAILVGCFNAFKMVWILVPLLH